MTVIKDRDGDTITVAEHGSGRGGAYLKTSNAWGVELDPQGVRELISALQKRLKAPEYKAAPGEVWGDRERPGRTVRVAYVSDEGVQYEVLTDSDDTVKTIAEGGARRSTVGNWMRVSWKTWAPDGITRGYFRIQEAPE